MTYAEYIDLYHVDLDAQFYLGHDHHQRIGHNEIEYRDFLWQSYLDYLQATPIEAGSDIQEAIRIALA